MRKIGTLVLIKEHLGMTSAASAMLAEVRVDDGTNPVVVQPLNAMTLERVGPLRSYAPRYIHDIVNQHGQPATKADWVRE